jgi:hypothetical protein
MLKMKPFTVIGVGSGHNCPRVHKHVLAYTAEEAVNQAEGLLNASPLLRAGDEKVTLLGAAVFAGHLQRADRDGCAPRADDRAMGAKNERRCKTLHDFTVVALDPATSRLAVEHVRHASHANAERNPAFDFFLLGGVIPGAISPELVCQSASGFLAAPSTRNERVMALTRYSSVYRDFLGNSLPMATMIPV